MTLHRDLDSIPVLARAGAIVPMVPLADLTFGTTNPNAIELRVYAGADGEFTIAEDRDDERWAFTRVRFADGAVHIDPVEGDLASVPRKRRFEIVLCGFIDVHGEHGPVPGSVRVVQPDVAATAGATLRIEGDLSFRTNIDVGNRAFELLDMAQISFVLKDQAYRARRQPRPSDRRTHHPRPAADAAWRTDRTTGREPGFMTGGRRCSDRAAEWSQPYQGRAVRVDDGRQAIKVVPAAGRLLPSCWPEVLSRGH